MDDFESMAKKVRSFEERMDKNDPEQVEVWHMCCTGRAGNKLSISKKWLIERLLQLLEQMKQHTRQLARLRGEWDRPSVHRDWNDPKATRNEQPPLQIEAFRYTWKMNLGVDNVSRRSS